MTYWEAADILEHGSVHYGKIIEASTIAFMVLKEKIKKLDEAEDAALIAALNVAIKCLEEKCHE